MGKCRSADSWPSHRGDEEKRLQRPSFTSITTGGNVCMGRIRRGGYIFLTWKADHGPRHVHVYRDGELVVKWDLENGKPMKGKATRRVRRLIAELEAEGTL